MLRSVEVVFLLAACITADKLPLNEGGRGGNLVHSEAAASSYSEVPASSVHAAPAPATSAYRSSEQEYHSNPASLHATYGTPEAHEQEGYYYYYYPVESQKPKAGVFSSDLGPYGNTVIVTLTVIGTILLLILLLGVESARSFSWVPSFPSIDIPYNEMLDITKNVYTAIQKEY